MDGSHLMGSEEVSEIGRDGGKASAVHGDNECCNDHEEGTVSDLLSPRNERIQQCAE